MPSHSTSLGNFLSELIAKHGYSNRSLATEAGVSEGAIRNLLKFGISADAKDPDPRTLTRVGQALGVDPIYLFRLVGYIPPDPAAPTARAEYLADIFDSLSHEKQDIVLSVLEAVIDKSAQRKSVQAMRADPKKALTGIDLSTPGYLRVAANQLIAHLDMVQPQDAALIKPDTIIQGIKWDGLPESTQRRIKALIVQKLSLDYDPTMVEPEWRE